MRTALALLLLASAAFAEPPAARTTFSVELRSAFRSTSGIERGVSPLSFSGGSFFDQSLAAKAFPHEALGLELEIGRHVALMGVERGAARPVELWDASAGLLGQANLGPLVAEAQLGYALRQLPSLVRGAGTPSSLHGARIGLGLMAPLPAGFTLSAHAAVLLPFESRDGRGERGDGHGSEIRSGVRKRIASFGQKRFGLGLEYRQRSQRLVDASGGILSQLVSHGLGLSLIMDQVAEDGS